MNAEGQHEALYLVYTPGEHDYTALVSRLKQAGIEVVYIGGYHSDAGLIARQAKEQGLHVQFLGSTTLQTKALWSIGGDAIEGFRHVFYADPRTLPSAADIVQIFDSRHIDPEGFVLYTYAAVQVWAEAAERAKTTDPHTVAATLKSADPGTRSWATCRSTPRAIQKASPTTGIHGTKATTDRCEGPTPADARRAAAMTSQRSMRAST